MRWQPAGPGAATGMWGGGDRCSSLERKSASSRVEYPLQNGGMPPATVPDGGLQRAARRAATASLRICSVASESSQPMQASVMLWP